MNYLIRCRIIDVTGSKVIEGIDRVTPEVSKPFIGKCGFAEREGSRIKIILDDGAIFFGEDCWWEPIDC